MSNNNDRLNGDHETSKGWNPFNWKSGEQLDKVVNAAREEYEQSTGRSDFNEQDLRDYLADPKGFCENVKQGQLNRRMRNQLEREAKDLAARDAQKAEAREARNREAEEATRAWEAEGGYVNEFGRCDRHGDPMY
jgi:hypothetical protein